jgi:ATP-dependent helicase/nuclease subunit B
LASVLNLPRRTFLPWDRPLLPQAVACLAGEWVGPEPLDLSRTLVVVPTRQSGRRLREALAEFAANRRSGVFAPRVLTPEALIAPQMEAGVASRLDVLLSWADVLRAAALDDFRDVFPVDPPDRSFGWAIRLAEQLSRLQATLRENALRITDVVAKAGADFPEHARWEQLAELERRQFQRLERCGLKPPEVAYAGAAKPAALAEIDRIILLATPDPMPALLEYLGRLALPIEVLVFAPAGESDRFDAWGRPLVAEWAARHIDLADFERRVHLCADPAEQGARIAGLAGIYRARPLNEPRRAANQRNRDDAAPGSADAWLGIGIADGDILPLVEAEVNRAGVAVFNPEGRPREQGALYHLLAALAGCADNPTFESVEQLSRCPDFLDYLARRVGRDFSAARFLAALDKLRNRHLPATLADAVQHAGADAATGLTAMLELHRQLSGGEFGEVVPVAVAGLFAGRILDPANERDLELQDAAAAWTETVRQGAVAATHFPGVPSSDWWKLTLRLYGDGRRTEEKPDAALELQGWLELLFEDAPHLVVAGFNDGFVPESVSDDPFLPESLRAKLGLKTNAARFARDAYMLQALAASRAATGRLDLLLGKVSTGGDPLRPSRLLLRCPDAELPRRVAFLFRSPDTVESHLPWTRAWRLKPRLVAAPKQVTVTSLKRWLVCPFRFYLKHALRMEAVDASKSEMDAFDFGTLCHAALEAMGREPAMRDCTDAGTLRDFLLAELTRHAHRKFGGELPLPLLIQVESARQRLAKLAEIQARMRAEGWVIQEVERPFSVGVAGLVVNGKVDRVDRHEGTGAIRVLDYKTSDASVAPRQAHLRPVRAGETIPAWTQVNVDGKLRAWADLQLPLYQHALGGAYGTTLSCGYINLPKAVGQTGLSLWDDYTPDLHESAVACAEGVCSAVAAATFWPPNEDLRAEADDFAALFHHGVADSVEWKGADR